MSQTRFTVATALAEAARTIHDSHSLQETLDAIVHAARTSVPGFDHVGISTVDRSGSVETKAATGDLVFELDDLQYTLREGPCMDSLSGERVVVVDDARHEQRWPRYIPHAARAGVTAQLAVPIGAHDDDGTRGGLRGALNLYGTDGGGIDPEAPGIAVLFTINVALALGWAHAEEQLNQALMTRKVIGQAVGILMERYQINEEKAFAFLARVSSTRNVKLREVASQLVAQSDTQYTLRGTE
jgi:GAF domain-containing protein